MTYQKRPRKLVEEKAEVPFWKSPYPWLCGLASVLVIGGPLVKDWLTPRVVGVLMVDVSQSNQRFKDSVTAVCQEFTENLVEGDTRIQGKFADIATIVNNDKFLEKDRLDLQQQCQQIMVPPADLGKNPGTSLIEAIGRIETEMEHQHSQGNNQPVAAIIDIDSAELVNKQPQDFTLIKSKIETIVQKGGAVVIIGSAVDLQNQLSQQLKDVKNTQLCTYADSQSCSHWLWETVRK